MHKEKLEVEAKYMEKSFEHLNTYYENYDEEGRLLSKHGQVEYLTTMKYIKKYLKPDMRILEIGAGTGRYSLTLARMGYHVEALELVQHNIDIFEKSITSDMDIVVQQGNALELSSYQDSSFDIVLLLGPMYHLYEKEDQLRAFSEALRVTKTSGLLFTSYCIMDASIICYGFVANNIKALIDKGLIDTEKFVALSTAAEIFQMYRKENIDELIGNFNVERLHYVATDLATNFMRTTVDNMSDEIFELYMKYHFCCCERTDMVGITHHSLDIVKKKKPT